VAKRVPDGIANYERKVPTRHSQKPAVDDAEISLRVGAQYRQVPVDRIRANRHQPSCRHRDVGDLALSILEVGLIHPPVVRRSDDGTFEAVAGHRRIRAWQALHMDGKVPKRIPAFVHAELSDTRVLQLMITENFHRQDVSALHDAEMIGRLWSLRSKELGRDPTSRELAAEIPTGKTSIHQSLVIYHALRDPRLAHLVRGADKIGKRLLATILAAPELRTTMTALEMAGEGKSSKEIDKFLRTSGRPSQGNSGRRTLRAVTRQTRGEWYDITFRVRQTMTAEELDQAIEEAERLALALHSLRRTVSEQAEASG
jgi:ParB family chromosome partitioning protein